MNAFDRFRRGEKVAGSRLTPIDIEHVPCGKYTRPVLVCLCECGNIHKVAPYDLGTKVRSCGCLRRAMSKNRATRHGLSERVEYQASKNAWARCNNPSHKQFNRYGGRGIEVRFESPEGMARWLMGNLSKPKQGEVLDRIDNDGHYEPGNLRWADRNTSMRNTSKTRFVTISGCTKPLQAWADFSGVSFSTIAYRIDNALPQSCWLSKDKTTKSKRW